MFFVTFYLNKNIFLYLNFSIIVIFKSKNKNLNKSLRRLFLKLSCYLNNPLFCQTVIIFAHFKALDIN